MLVQNVLPPVYPEKKADPVMSVLNSQAPTSTSKRRMCERDPVLDVLGWTKSSSTSHGKKRRHADDLEVTFEVNEYI